MKENYKISLSKTSDTPYLVRKIEFKDENVSFLPVSKINELRREILEKLTQKILSKYNLIHILSSINLVCGCVSRSVVSDFLQPHGLQPARVICPWNSSGMNTGVDCHSLLQRIFPTQGLNSDLLHCRRFAITCITI